MLTVYRNTGRCSLSSLLFASCVISAGATAVTDKNLGNGYSSPVVEVSLGSILGRT